MIPILNAHRSGDLGLANRLVDELLKAQPNHADGLLSKGMIQMGRGDHAGALDSVRLSLASDPHHRESLTWAAHLCLRQNTPGAAEGYARRLVEVGPQNARGLYLLASALGAQKRTQEAISAIDEALKIQPNDVDSLVLKARLLKSWGLPALAGDFYRQAMAVRPNPAAAIDLAQILMKESHPEEALDLLQKTSGMLPENLRPYDLIAKAQTELHRFDLAQKSWSLAEKFSRDGSGLSKARIKSEISAGRFDVAEELISQLLATESDSSAGFLLLTTARKITPADGVLIDQMAGLLASERLPVKQVVELNYGLGKAMDDLGEYGKAIAYYDEGNRLSAAVDPDRIGFREVDAKAFTEFQISYFTTMKIREISERGMATDQPIFIVGLPRSGTTLTETILGAHSAIFAGGEQSFWPEHAIDFLEWKPNPVDVRIDLALQFATDYLDLMESHDPSILRFTDKNPNNFQYVALLHALFPNAKFVTLRRHLVDNLLSMWMTPEVGSFFGTRENLIAMVREHRRLLRHLQEVVPADRFASFSYEDLTSNPEDAIPAIFRHLELDPEPACFRPEESSRTVLTPSVRQVRQAIHSDSQARWKRYESWLGPFAELADE